MPELPEVEVIGRGLQPHLVGRRVVGLMHSGKALRHPLPTAHMCRQLLDHNILSVSRRAKCLLLSLNNGAVLVIHLGMTGRLSMVPQSQEIAKHDHVRLLLDNQMELRYNDSRRFGSIRLVAPTEAAILEQTLFAHYGPEPFGKNFTADYLHTLATGKATPVKTFIMTNATVVGVGNIYACESLFAAGIRPTQKTCSLTRQQWEKLVAAIRKTLEHAIECGGSTISDYLNAQGEPGYFQMQFRVYGRQGDPCRVCRDPIQMIRLAGRASFYCPNCQR